ncbi:MAG: hypothetical protein LBU23_11680 [Planctomycetota bacterium]|jgi:tetratricopeptide (TPR) repeat protein|nr:hypothetical protein [Planctomycetota bacterium]
MQRLLFAAAAASGWLAMSGGGFPAAAGEPGVTIQVASRAFVVSVAPVDRASEEAESSLLYQQRADGLTWEEIGLCRKEILPNRGVRFTREVAVEADGVYYFTSRPVVSGKVADPPDSVSLPQASVTVDTLPPIASIAEPPEGSEILPGQTLRIRWNSEDENLPPLPVALSHSPDGGKSWHNIGEALPAEGETLWTVPEYLAGPALIRLAAVDKAGNLGRDSRRLALARLPAAEPEAPTTPRQAADKPAAPAEPATAAAEKPPNRGNSWLYYLMALNLMRQEKPADALQYYWLSVGEDADFIEAWADIGLAYNALGAYKTAREVTEQTLDRAPERADVMHLLGEINHAEGMKLLAAADSPEKRLRAKGLIDQAAAWYGRSLDRAAADWRLAEQAASFFRLGEICYYVNLDRDGARAYWEKILELHAPTPNPDLALWTPEERRGRVKTRLQHDTARWVSLAAWQNWARGYLEQLDARERAGLIDLAPTDAAARPEPLIYAGNAINPGRADGRSIFSPPTQLGSPAPVPAATGMAGPERRFRPLDGYSFYAGKRTGNEKGTGRIPVRNARRQSIFSGGPPAPPPPNPDPYAFPNRGRATAEWNRPGPYGEQMSDDWQ